ncbi:MAG: hypothetical protein K2X47_05215, partial [Bdellovibrionales bacterium]|nr:hypothetical protein [Bdellovibrionales bacterium]
MSQKAISPNGIDLGVLESETKAFAGEDLSQIKDKAYQARLIAQDLYLASEAARIWEPQSTLENARRLLAEWKYDEVSALISEHLKTETSAQALGEWYLESARLQFYLGNFQCCMEHATLCLGFSPHAPTRISAAIVRAGSAFELGLIPLTVSELRNLQGLMKLYPGHPGDTYIQVLRIRIVARTQGLDAAHLELKNFERRLATETVLDMDALHVYLRARNDLCRLEGKLDLGTAAACVKVAEAIGDDLFRGFDLVDLWIALGSPLESSLLSEIQYLGTRHPRLRKLMDQIVSENTPENLITTAAGMRALHKNSRDLPKYIGPIPQSSQIVSTESGFQIDL